MSLAMALAMKRKKSHVNEKEDPTHEPKANPIIQGIMKKHLLAMGGMPETPESQEEGMESPDPDFLSDEEQDQAQDLTYPDPDEKEETEGQHKGVLHNILSDFSKKKRSLK